MLNALQFGLQRHIFIVISILASTVFCICKWDPQQPRYMYLQNIYIFTQFTCIVHQTGVRAYVVLDQTRVEPRYVCDRSPFPSWFNITCYLICVQKMKGCRSTWGWINHNSLFFKYMWSVINTFGPLQKGLYKNTIYIFISVCHYLSLVRRLFWLSVFISIAQCFIISLCKYS